MLKNSGIDTPVVYKNEQGFTKWYSINGYDVVVTVEEFVSGELCCVDVDAAEKTGKLLAKMHNIAEVNNFHVENDVLFDPFTDNDLFTVSDFMSHEKDLIAVNILPAFLKGYHKERPFSDVQKSKYPYLYAIVNAFWGMDIKWNEDSLLRELEQGNIKAVHRWLEEIQKRLLMLEPMRI